MVLVIGCFLLSSCASKVTPTGGAKDVTPPKFLKAYPENFSVNFSSKEIVISFDEYIQGKDLEKQLVVSPIIKPAPEVKVKNKNLLIEINTPLLPNTTYTFNFGNAIVDNHEGNALDNFQYVFSTGAFLDSLSIKGKVEFAENLKTEKGIYVMLYRNNDDSLPLKSPPEYFAKTDTTGNFSINNIAQANYKIIALKDVDANYMFNSADEYIAYSDSTVYPSDSLSVKLSLFKEEPKTIFLKKSFFETKGKVVLAFNKPATAVQLNTLDNSILPVQIKEFSVTKDTVTLWLKDTLTDSLHFTAREDTLVIDTVALHYNKEAALLKTVSSPKLSITTNASAGLNPNEKLLLEFSQPLYTDKILKDSITISEDSIPLKDINIVFADSGINRKCYIDFKQKEKKSYKLYIPPGTFKSIYGLTNDTIKSNIALKSINELGSVTVKLKGITEGNYLLQLLNDKDEVQTEKKITAEGNYSFELLDPMKYKLRLIDDKNNNSKWDTGNYLKKIQPEKVYYCKEELNIRANWDLEQEWVIKAGKEH
jgi:hypothetical protein